MKVVVPFTDNYFGLETSRLCGWLSLSNLFGNSNWFDKSNIDNNKAMKVAKLGYYSMVASEDKNSLVPLFITSKLFTISSVFGGKEKLAKFFSECCNEEGYTAGVTNKLIKINGEYVFHMTLILMGCGYLIEIDSAGDGSIFIDATKSKGASVDRFKNQLTGLYVCIENQSGYMGEPSLFTQSQLNHILK